MADTFREVVLMTIRENPSQNKEGAGTGMWVIQNVKNEKSNGVKVVCGPYWPDKNTGKTRYPIGGLGVNDFSALKLRWPEVKAMMANPPPIAAEVPATATNETDEPF